MKQANVSMKVSGAVSMEMTARFPVAEDASDRGRSPVDALNIFVGHFAGGIRELEGGATDGTHADLSLAFETTALDPGRSSSRRAPSAPAPEPEPPKKPARRRRRTS
jgi:hypothetical protein